MIKIERTTVPQTEPVTLQEAKDHLRVDGSTEDSLISSLIAAARQHLEETVSRSFVTQTWKLYLDDFPVSKLVHIPWGEYMDIEKRAILLPRPPVASVTSITYIASDGTTQTLSTDDYDVDLISEPARIAEAEGATWPTTDNTVNAVTVEYQAGYGNAGEVPQAIKQAVLLLLSTWYENRQTVIVGASIDTLPMSVQALMAPYRVYV